MFHFACFLVLFLNFALHCRADGSKGKSVNVALETVFEFDKQNLDADVKIIDNVQRFLSKVRKVLDKTKKTYRRSLGGRGSASEDMKFTDFLAHILSSLKHMDDTTTEDLIIVFDDEIRKYHYKGCKFYELVQKEDIRKYISQLLFDMRHTSKPKLREIFKRLNNKLKNKEFGKEELKFVTYMNTLYDQNASEAMHEILDSFDNYRRANSRSKKELTRLVRDSLRKIIFDHYTNLNRNVKKDLQNRLTRLFEGYTITEKKKNISDEKNKKDEHDDEYSLHLLEVVKVKDNPKKPKKRNTIKRAHEKSDEEKSEPKKIYEKSDDEKNNRNGSGEKKNDIITTTDSVKYKYMSLIPEARITKKTTVKIIKHISRAWKHLSLHDDEEKTETDNNNNLAVTPKKRFDIAKHVPTSTSRIPKHSYSKSSKNSTRNEIIMKKTNKSKPKHSYKAINLSEEEKAENHSLRLGKENDSGQKDASSQTTSNQKRNHTEKYIEHVESDENTDTLKDNKRNGHFNKRYVMHPKKNHFVDSKKYSSEMTKKKTETENIDSDISNESDNSKPYERTKVFEKIMFPEYDKHDRNPQKADEDGEDKENDKPNDNIEITDGEKIQTNAHKNNEASSEAVIVSDKAHKNDKSKVSHNVKHEKASFSKNTKKRWKHTTQAEKPKVTYTESSENTENLTNYSPQNSDESENKSNEKSNEDGNNSKTQEKKHQQESDPEISGERHFKSYKSQENHRVILRQGKKGAKRKKNQKRYNIKYNEEWINRDNSKYTEKKHMSDYSDYTSDNEQASDYYSENANEKVTKIFKKNNMYIEAADGSAETNDRERFDNEAQRVTRFEKLNPPNTFLNKRAHKNVDRINEKVQKMPSFKTVRVVRIDRPLDEILTEHNAIIRVQRYHTDRNPYRSRMDPSYDKRYRNNKRRRLQKPKSNRKQGKKRSHEVLNGRYKSNGRLITRYYNEDEDKDDSTSDEDKKYDKTERARSGRKLRRKNKRGRKVLSRETKDDHDSDEIAMAKDDKHEAVGITKSQSFERLKSTMWSLRHHFRRHRNELKSKVRRDDYVERKKVLRFCQDVQRNWTESTTTTPPPHTARWKQLSYRSSNSRELRLTTQRYGYFTTKMASVQFTPFHSFKPKLKSESDPPQQASIKNDAEREDYEEMLNETVHETSINNQNNSMSPDNDINQEDLNDKSQTYTLLMGEESTHNYTKPAYELTTENGPTRQELLNELVFKSNLNDNPYGPNYDNLDCQNDTIADSLKTDISSSTKTNKNLDSTQRKLFGDSLKLSTDDVSSSTIKQTKYDPQTSTTILIKLKEKTLTKHDPSLWRGSFYVDSNTMTSQPVLNTTSKEISEKPTTIEVNNAQTQTTSNRKTTTKNDDTITVKNIFITEDNLEQKTGVPRPHEIKLQEEKIKKSYDEFIRQSQKQKSELRRKKINDLFLKAPQDFKKNYDSYTNTSNKTTSDPQETIIGRRQNNMYIDNSKYQNLNKVGESDKYDVEKPIVIDNVHDFKENIQKTVESKQHSRDNQKMEYMSLELDTVYQPTVISRS